MNPMDRVYLVAFNRRTGEVLLRDRNAKDAAPMLFLAPRRLKAALSVRIHDVGDPSEWVARRVRIKIIDDGA